MFLEKRAQYSISNLKLPSIIGGGKKGGGRTFQYMKHVDSCQKSEALSFNKPKDWVEKQQALTSDNHDLDLVLKNIRAMLVSGTKKLKTVSPDLIDQIYRFENLNDLSKHIDIEGLVNEHQDLLKQMHKKDKRRGKSFKVSPYNQFGYESSG